MSRRARGIAIVACALVVVAAYVPERALANIEEQRARLPPPAPCTDPVEGVWMSHAWYPHIGHWYIFKMEIHRVPRSPTALTGAIHAHYWPGEQNVEPPVCGAVEWRRAISAVTATGTIVGNRLQFRGTRLGPIQLLCGPPPTTENVLATWTGTLDPALHEFQSVLDAGPTWVAVPTVFRRIRCLTPEQSAPQPHVEIRPPPIAPSRGGPFGCSVGMP